MIRQGLTNQARSPFKKGTASDEAVPFWCPEQDSNLHVVANTGP